MDKKTIWKTIIQTLVTILAWGCKRSAQPTTTQARNKTPAASEKNEGRVICFVYLKQSQGVFCRSKGKNFLFTFNYAIMFISLS